MSATRRSAVLVLAVVATLGTACRGSDLELSDSSTDTGTERIREVATSPEIRPDGGTKTIGRDGSAGEVGDERGGDGGTVAAPAGGEARTIES